MEHILMSVVDQSHNMVTFSWGFEALYRAEYSGIVTVATAVTGDRAEGEDLAQDTMVKAFLHWPKVAGLDQPQAWCHRVLINAY